MGGREEWEKGASIGGIQREMAVVAFRAQVFDGGGLTSDASGQVLWAIQEPGPVRRAAPHTPNPSIPPWRGQSRDADIPRVIPRIDVLTMMMRPTNAQDESSA
jgi:hypothetical protein